MHDVIRIHLRTHGGAHKTLGVFPHLWFEPVRNLAHGMVIAIGDPLNQLEDGLRLVILDHGIP
ncbi:MAG: hypothetical protein U0791_00455 [Gemmataceae bacterium]